MAKERIEITLKTVKLLAARDFSYYCSTQVSRFYRVTDENDTVYTISTSHLLYAGDKITAQVVGENDWYNEHQIKLTRVSVLNRGEAYHIASAKLFNSYYIADVISTD